MTKEVLLSISGLHYEVFPEEEEQTEDEPIEILSPATYYYKNGKHYVIYDELVEGMPGSIKNKIRISDGLLEITKSGLTNTRMVFEKDKINMTEYETPYGGLLVGIYTRNMQVDVQEREIGVSVSYALDVNGEKVADCDIRMNIRANQKGA